MHKLILSLFASLIAWSSCFAATTNISEAARRSYASKFHDAFVLQSNGLSTRAFYLFKEAYQEALAAGESLQKAIVMEDLFKWYRTYGTELRLFIREPTGNDRIVGPSRFAKTPRFHSPLNSTPYRSEWGKTPEQAGHIRDFMFGIAQVISGIFCVTVGGPIVAPLGAGTILTGVGTMYYSLNHAWIDHQKALLELQVWEANVKKATAN